MSNQGELKSVTMLDIIIIFENVAIPMNFYNGVWRKFFATKMFVNKTFQGMFWPCRFDVNYYHFRKATDELKESLFRHLFLFLTIKFFQSFQAYFSMLVKVVK